MVDRKDGRKSEIIYKPFLMNGIKLSADYTHQRGGVMKGVTSVTLGNGY